MHRTRDAMEQQGGHARVDRDGWVRPTAEEVAPGVHRIPLPLPSDALRAVNVYAIRDGDRLTLIDGGWAIEAAEEALTRALDTMGYGLEHVQRFLVTHAHRDHYTNAVAVRRHYGARVAIGEEERPQLEHTARVASSAPRTQLPCQVHLLRRAGAPELADRIANSPEDVDPRDWLPPDEWVADGARLLFGDRSLAAVHTPGHTSGHLVFHDPSAGLLFAGDHVLPHITPSIGFQSLPMESPLREYLASLHLVRAMPDARLLPAHGPVTASVHERVDELIAHHEERLDLTFAALAAGATTAMQVAAGMYWTRRRRRIVDMDPFNEMLAVLETAAHLAVLEERSLVVSETIDGVVHYRGV